MLSARAQEKLVAFSAVALLGIALDVFAAVPARADKVGVAAAVNPDAFSSLSGAPTNQLNIGKSIFFNERIKTTDSGLVQVLLVDGSTFTVGPGSNLVIDKFVYNPKKGTGEITTTLSKGVMRYVGGKISKNEDAVKMKTPAGTLAIRGGMYQILINGGGKGIISFLYGVGLTFTAKSGEVQKLFQPGYTLDLTGAVAKIRPTDAADTNSIMKAFARGGSGTGTANTGGVGGIKPNNTNGNTVQISNTISEIINTFTQSQIQAALDEELKQQPQNPTVTPTSTPAHEPSQPDSPGSTLPPPAPPPPPNPGGYAAGILVSHQPAPFTNVVASQSNQDFILNGDSATMTLHDIDNADEVTSRYVFSGLTSLGGPPTASVFDDAGLAYSQASASGRLAPSPEPEFSLCDECEFLEWGSFQTETTFSNGGDPQFADRINGWWVSGNLTSASEINALEALGATATYNGRVIGTVLSHIEPYKATGDLLMNWSFRDRNGSLTISNFDGRNFGTVPSGLTQPNRAVNQFGGTLTADGLSGRATGSFVRGPNSPAQGVIGNWRIGGGGYSAAGIFGGRQAPATQ